MSFDGAMPGWPLPGPSMVCRPISFGGGSDGIEPTGGQNVPPFKPEPTPRGAYCPPLNALNTEQLFWSSFALLSHIGRQARFRADIREAPLEPVGVFGYDGQADTLDVGGGSGGTRPGPRGPG